LGDNWEIIKNSSQAIIRNTKKSSC
jgi:hypothetical protein